MEITQKVWPNTQTNILKSRFQSRGYIIPNPVPDNLDNAKKLDDFLRDILKEKRINKRTKYRECFGKASAKNY